MDLHNGEIKGTTYLHVQANAVSLTEIDPETVDLGDINLSELSKTFDIKISRGKSKTYWNQIKGYSNNFLINTSIINQDSYILHCYLNLKRCQIGTLNDVISAEVSNNGNLVEKEEIPVRAKIISDVKVSPETIFLGVINQNDAKEGNFEIISEVMPLKLIEIKHSNLDPFTVNLISSQPDKLSFHYRFEPRNLHGNVSGKITISVFNGNVRNMILRYIIYVK